MHLHAPCLQVKFLGDEIILEKKERQVLRLEANQGGRQGGEVNELRLHALQSLLHVTLFS